jgi:hypothetical protein
MRRDESDEARLRALRDAMRDILATEGRCELDFAGPAPRVMLATWRVCKIGRS